MKRRYRSPEQIVRKLGEAERKLGEGTSQVEVCKHLEVWEQTYYRWRNQYGGMKADGAKRLKELERENAHLTDMVEVSQRRACVVVGQPRSTQRLPPTAVPNAEQHLRS